MNFSIHHYILSLLFLGVATVPSAHGQGSEKLNLEYDHILLFVSNYALKDSLDNYFTPADKLTTKHQNQGTIGHYYLFYNTYIELLFLEDSTATRLNKDNFGSDYASRWGKDRESCPIGFGMIASTRDTNITTKDFHKYQSADAPDTEYYLMSNHNRNLSQPLIYVSMPHRAYKAIKTSEEIDQRPEEIRKDLKNYLTHPSRVQNITQIIYAPTSKVKINGNLSILNVHPKIEVSAAKSTSLKLVFDHVGKHHKTFKINDYTNLMITY